MTDRITGLIEAEEVPTRVLRRRDLPEHPDPGVLLYCPGCCAEYSATRGDYFMLEPHEEMGPCECGEYLRLVQKTTTIEPYRVAVLELLQEARAHDEQTPTTAGRADPAARKTQTRDAPAQYADADDAGPQAERTARVDAPRARSAQKSERVKGGIMYRLREWWWWWDLNHTDRVRIRRLRTLKLVSRNALYEADHHRLGTSAAYDVDCPTCRRGKNP